MITISGIEKPIIIIHLFNQTKKKENEHALCALIRQLASVTRACFYLLWALSRCQVMVSPQLTVQKAKLFY